MILREKSNYKELAKDIFDKMPNDTKTSFLEPFGWSSPSKGRINFLSLARYGKRGGAALKIAILKRFRGFQ